MPVLYTVTEADATHSKRLWMCIYINVFKGVKNFAKPKWMDILYTTSSDFHCVSLRSVFSLSVSLRSVCSLSVRLWSVFSLSISLRSVCSLSVRLWSVCSLSVRLCSVCDSAFRKVGTCSTEVKPALQTCTCRKLLLIPQLPEIVSVYFLQCLSWRTAAHSALRSTL